MRRSVLALLLALTFSAAVRADDDPPTRVARLSLTQGVVSLQAAGEGAPEEAELNRPITWGDRLLTDRGSRAEMSVGTAAIRLDENTDLSIANLDADIVQLELNSGTLGIHVRELGETETFEIDTPNAAVLLREPGDYRITVDSQNATLLAVRTGGADVDGGAGPIGVNDHQELRFTGVEQVVDVRALGPLTGFDEWCIERERTLAERESTRYVSRDVVGYEDLDRHGIWWNEPGYGNVWAPTYISIGWAPYRFGHWTWIGPWGFTWIDHTPWGYAPFHYGRWAHVRNRWCWVPGPRHFRPVWAPALVGWHGGTPGVRDPSRPGSVSWFPLGPREVYVPNHRASPRYVRAVNVSNTTIDNNARITNAWRGRLREPGHANRGVPNAISTLPAAAFSGGHSQAGRVVRGIPTESGRGVPHLTTLQPNGETRLRGTFNTRRAEVGREPPAIRSGGIEQPLGDQRRTLPRVPTDRRTVQGVPTESSAGVDARKGRRAEQPPKRPYEQRAAPADTWQQSRPQSDSRQFNRNAGTDSERSNRGGTTQPGGRSERAGNSAGEARVSGSGSQSGRGGAVRSGSGGGGESRMSGSSNQSSRGGSIARP